MRLPCQVNAGRSASGLIAIMMGTQIIGILKRDREQVLEALEMVAAEPARRVPFVTEMVGQQGVWRVWQGNWRAVYRWREADVVVDRIGNRRDVYR